jgi:hypothetical protein
MSPIHPSHLARLSFPPNSRDLAQEKSHLITHKDLQEDQGEKDALPLKKKSKRDLLLGFLKFESATSVRIPQIVLKKMIKRTSLITSLLSKLRRPMISSRR